MNFSPGCADGPPLLDVELNVARTTPTIATGSVAGGASWVDSTRTGEWAAVETSDDQSHGPKVPDAFR